MKKFQILILLFCAISFYVMGMEVSQTKKTSLYGFFNIEQFKNLDKELKDIIAQKYGQWWCHLTTFENLGLIKSLKFHPQSDKILIGTYSETGVIEKLFDLQGNLLQAFYPNYINGIRLDSLYFRRNEFDFIGSSRLMAFDHQGKYIAIAYKLLDSEDTLIELYGLDGNFIKNLIIEDSILALTFNMQDQIVILVKSSQYIIAQWYDINFNLIKEIKKEFPGLCCFAALNEEADKALLQFDKCLNKAEDKLNCNNHLILKWDINRDCSVADSLIFQHKNVISSMAIAPQGDKVVIAFLDEIRILNWDGNSLITFKHLEPCSEMYSVGLPLPCTNLLEFSPNGKMILTAHNFSEFAKLWDLEGNCLVSFQHYGHICYMSFNPEGNVIAIGSTSKVKLWALYEKPTLEQILLRKLIHLYLQTKKPSREIQSSEILFRNIVAEFKSQDIELDEEELKNIWNSIPETVRTSLWNSIKKTISKFGK